MHLRAMRHSTIRVVRHPGNWSAIVMGLAGSALLPAVLRDSSTASPAFTAPSPCVANRVSPRSGDKTMGNHPPEPRRWLADTKFHPPLLRADVIPRPRLLDALHDAVLSHPLTLVSAPAGYGKTTLLADFGLGLMKGSHE